MAYAIKKGRNTSNKHILNTRGLVDSFAKGPSEGMSGSAIACVRAGSRLPGQHDDAHYVGHRFPPEVISYAIWLYFPFPLSLRMVEEMLAVHGIVVSHETVR
jgi:hypothetical protein